MVVTNKLNIAIGVMIKQFGTIYKGDDDKSFFSIDEEQLMGLQLQTHRPAAANRWVCSCKPISPQLRDHQLLFNE